MREKAVSEQTIFGKSSNSLPVKIKTPGFILVSREFVLKSINRSAFWTLLVPKSIDACVTFFSVFGLHRLPSEILSFLAAKCSAPGSLLCLSAALVIVNGLAQLLSSLRMTQSAFFKLRVIHPLTPIHEPLFIGTNYAFSPHHTSVSD